jgi:hypothetical protein
MADMAPDEISPDRLAPFAACLDSLGIEADFRATWEALLAARDFYTRASAAGAGPLFEELAAAGWRTRPAGCWPTSIPPPRSAGCTCRSP